MTGADIKRLLERSRKELEPEERKARADAMARLRMSDDFKAFIRTVEDDFIGSLREEEAIPSDYSQAVALFEWRAIRRYCTEIIHRADTYVANEEE